MTPPNMGRNSTTRLWLRDRSGHDQPFVLVTFTTQPGVARRVACAAISRAHDLDLVGEARVKKESKIMQRDCASGAL
jgi:hypothetical protein